MSTQNDRPEVAKLQRIAARHISKVAAALRGLVARRDELAKLAAALEDALDEITPAHLRYRIRRWLEVTMMLILTVGEVIVADTVVQALGLSATSTELVAVVVGGAASGLAWLVGHEWAIAHDHQAVAAGRRSLLGVAAATTAAFLMANLAVRVYYGLLAEQTQHLGSGLIAPLLAGSLLTAVTTTLMLVAAFVSAHSETSKEAELRRRLRKVRRELRVLDDHIGRTDVGHTSERLAVVGE